MTGPRGRRTSHHVDVFRHRRMHQNCRALDFIGACVCDEMTPVIVAGDLLSIRQVFRIFGRINRGSRRAPVTAIPL